MINFNDTHTDLLFNNLDEGVLIIKKNPLSIAYSNNAIEKMLGFKSLSNNSNQRDEFLKIIYDDDNFKFSSFILTSFSSPSNNGVFTIKLNSLSSHYIKFTCNSYQLIYMNEEAVLFMITELSNENISANQLSNDTTRIYGDMVEDDLEWVWELDINFNYIYSNMAVFNLTGYFPDNIKGKNFFDFLTIEKSGKLKNEFNKCFHNNVGFYNLYKVVLHKNGKFRLLTSTAVPIIDFDGKVIGYRGIDTDITEKEGSHDFIKNFMYENELYNNNIKLFILDNQTLNCKLLSLSLSKIDDIEVKGFSDFSYDNILSTFKKTVPDVVLLGLNMPHYEGLSILPRLLKEFPKIRIIALSENTEPMIINKSFSLGVTGFISKFGDIDELLTGIEKTSKGIKNLCKTSKSSLANNSNDCSIPNNENNSDICYCKNFHLTKREKEILGMILAENTNSEIADKLFISKRTAETHRKNLLHKLGVKNSIGLIRNAIEYNLISLLLYFSVV